MIFKGHTKMRVLNNPKIFSHHVRKERLHPEVLLLKSLILFLTVGIIADAAAIDRPRTNRSSGTGEQLSLYSGNNPSSGNNPRTLPGGEDDKSIHALFTHHLRFISGRDMKMKHNRAASERPPRRRGCKDIPALKNQNSTAKNSNNSNDDGVDESLCLPSRARHRTRPKRRGMRHSRESNFSSLHPTTIEPYRLWLPDTLTKSSRYLYTHFFRTHPRGVGDGDNYIHLPKNSFLVKSKSGRVKHFQETNAEVPPADDNYEGEGKEGVVLVSEEDSFNETDETPELFVFSRRNSVLHYPLDLLTEHVDDAIKRNRSFSQTISSEELIFTPERPTTSEENDSQFVKQETIYIESLPEVKQIGRLATKTSNWPNGRGGRPGLHPISRGRQVRYTKGGNMVAKNKYYSRNIANNLKVK